jgi:hypothetical protein
MKSKDQISLEAAYNSIIIAEDASNNLDKLQLALDVAGIEPTVGMVADGANAIISTLRAAVALADKDNDTAKKHAINAGISAISLIPFADVVKLVKVRDLRKPAVMAARALKTTGKAYRDQRAASSATQLKG